MSEQATTDYTLAELCIVACAEAWRGDGEILASGTVEIRFEVERTVRLNGLFFIGQLDYRASTTGTGAGND